MKTLRECFDSFRGRLIGKIDHFFDDYEIHLRPFVSTPARLLEIGVHGGGSLELWRTYFGSKAEIHGLDIDPAAAETAPEDCRIHIGAQGDGDMLRQLAEKQGPFDIIIDDGSHRMADQIASFEALYSTMSPSGVYICEDAFTSYWREYGGKTDAPGTFMHYAKHLIDELHAYWRLDDGIEPSGFTLSTRAIHFYSGTVVFQRHPVQAPEYVMRHRDQINRMSISALKTAAG
jgi:hypothetical protein